MSYTIRYTDINTTPIQVNDADINITSVDIALVGRLYEYGQQFNENLLHLLENFACPESATNPGTPDLTQTSANELHQPTEGQLWFNESSKTINVYDGVDWKALQNRSDIAANFGKILSNQYLPLPVNDLGYQYSIDECIFTVSPARILEQFDYQQCSVDQNGLVNVLYRNMSGEIIPSVANYIIMGIKNNINNGSQSAVTIPGPIVPSPTPTVTPSPTPTVTPSPGESPTPTPTPNPVALCSGLVSYWDFESFSNVNKIIDITGANDLTTTFGSPTLVSGKINTNALRIASSQMSNVVAGGTGFIGGGSTNGYSFGGWYKFPVSAANHLNNIFYGPGFFVSLNPALNGTQGRLHFFRQYNSFPQFAFYTDRDATDFHVNDDTWHFFVFTVGNDGDTFTVYKDNVNLGSATRTSGSPGTNGASQFLKFGSGLSGEDFAVDGAFYYDRLINASEVSSLYNSGSGRQYTDLCPAVTPSPTPIASPTPTPSVTPTRTVTPTVTPSPTPNPAYVITGGYTVSTSGLNSARGYSGISGPPYDIGSIDHTDFGIYNFGIIAQGHYTHTGSPYSIIHVQLGGAPTNAFTSIKLTEPTSGITYTLNTVDASTSPGSWAWYVDFSTNFFPLGQPRTVYIVP